MEPTTPDRTTWKHWAATLALLIFGVFVVPLIASLPLALAYALAASIAIVIMLLTRRIGRTRP